MIRRGGRGHGAEERELALEVAGTIHDLNNVLLLLNSCLDEVERARDEPVGSRTRQQMRAATESAIRLVERLARAIRPPAHEVGAASNVNAVIKEVLPLLTALADGVPIHTDLGRAGRVALDRTALERILMNLIANSRDASLDRTAITIVTRRIDDEGPSSAVELIIVDGGVGMLDEVRERASEPYFSTKDDGPISGLGLSVVRRVVAAAGGLLSIESEPGKGTRVAVRLPAAGKGRDGA